MAATPVRFAKRESAAPPVAEVLKAVAVPSETPADTKKAQKWDIFVSHASPDKPYVRQLVVELRKADIAVWFDEDSIAWGESLRPAINKGLINSSYAIVVLSKPFLAERKWTEHELNGLFAREKVGRFIILPIWHGIEHEDLVNYDPALADRLAKVSATDGIPDIVRSALQALGRAPVDIPIAPEIKQNLAQAQERGAEARELVAYAWYEQKGPDAEREQIYIRRSNFMRDGFVLINGDQEHDGTQDDVAGRFFMADKHLKAKGFVRMQFSNPSNLPAFEI
jgi:TIR domain